MRCINYTSFIATIGFTPIKKCMAVCCFDNIAVAILYMPVKYKLYFKIQPFFINKYYISNIAYELHYCYTDSNCNIVN